MRTLTTCFAVLDLPQLYTEPSAKALLNALALLAYAPPSWECSDDDEPNKGYHGSDNQRLNRAETVEVSPEGVTQYLTGIVSNGLRWIQDDEAREKIWNQASARLSERSGRTAMGAISRKFRVPAPDGMFELSIYEPALTGDDLGLKTWAASYLLAKRLATFDLVRPDKEIPRVLELGSGTGLVGLAMAALGADVVLTDLPGIYQNLAYNARANFELVRRNGGTLRTGVLDWNNPSSCLLFPLDAANTKISGEPLTAKVPIILAADSLYSSEHPRLLVDTIEMWLSNGNDARVIVELPYRDAYLAEIADFRARMGKIGLQVLDEGEEKGFDDWGWSGAGDKRDDSAVVTCWWSRWGRK